MFLMAIGSAAALLLVIYVFHVILQNNGLPGIPGVDGFINEWQKVARRPTREIGVNVNTVTPSTKKASTSHVIPYSALASSGGTPATGSMGAAKRSTRKHNSTTAAISMEETFDPLLEKIAEEKRRLEQKKSDTDAKAQLAKRRLMDVLKAKLAEEERRKDLEELTKKVAETPLDGKSERKQPSPGAFSSKSSDSSCEDVEEKRVAENEGEEKREAEKDREGKRVAEKEDEDKKGSVEGKAGPEKKCKKHHKHHQLNINDAHAHRHKHHHHHKRHRTKGEIEGLLIATVGGEGTTE